MTTTEPAEHRYLQVARALRKEIVDGVYPVGSQLPTEYELCERFAVSRYTVREALRRLRDDNLVSSRPRTGTQVIPRTSSSSYAQDVMSINDLLAFASGAQFEIESNAMITVDADTAARTGLALGEQWLAVSGYRRAGDGTPICRTEYYVNRAFAAVGRIYVSPLSGVLSQSIGWPAFFLFSIVVAVPGVVMVWWLRDALGRLGRPQIDGVVDD